VAVGGTLFQKFGIFGNYWKETGSQLIDEGRFNETKAPADKYLFKVPSLRNVVMTPPYFHDGSGFCRKYSLSVKPRLSAGKITLLKP